ncbi:probable calcium-binding protein CML46 [Aristolochia californica]|uniref:probable calcium-binding protein CML46 n=1 Tax=Aristolochia californica TaxID=171875 RepID=UPI0035DCE17C
MDTVMERLGMRKEAEKTQRPRWNWRCQDCTFLQGVSLLEEKEASMDELKGAFSSFDENGDGFITEAELQEVMHKLELKEGKELENCRKMIRAFDKNGDGKIDLEEFKFLLENTV